MHRMSRGTIMKSKSKQPKLNLFQYVKHREERLIKLNILEDVKKTTIKHIKQLKIELNSWDNALLKSKHTRK